MSPQQSSSEPRRVDPPKVVLRTVDEGYGHLIGIAPLQLRVAIDINHLVRLADLGTDGSHLRYRLLAQMTALPGQYDDPLTPLGELDHGTIFHDAGDVASEGRGMRRPIRPTANRTAPPTRDSTETSRRTHVVAPAMSAVPSAPSSISVPATATATPAIVTITVRLTPAASPGASRIDGRLGSNTR